MKKTYLVGPDKLHVHVHYDPWTALFRAYQLSSAGNTHSLSSAPPVYIRRAHQNTSGSAVLELMTCTCICHMRVSDVHWFHSLHVHVYQFNYTNYFLNISSHPQFAHQLQSIGVSNSFLSRFVRQFLSPPPVPSPYSLTTSNTKYVILYTCNVSADVFLSSYWHM